MYSFLIVCVCVPVCARAHVLVEVRGQPVRVSSLLPSCGSWGIKLGLPGLRASHLSLETSFWPFKSYLSPLDALHCFSMAEEVLWNVFRKQPLVVRMVPRDGLESFMILRMSLVNFALREAKSISPSLCHW